MEIRSHISNSGVQVDVDAPKGQDLSQLMEDVRSNYEKIAVKNAEDLKRWHENQVMWCWKGNRAIFVKFLGITYFPVSLSDCRCTGGGITEHRSSPGGPDGDEWLSQTVTDPWNWTFIPTELGKYFTIIFCLYLFANNQIFSLYLNYCCNNCLP